jgi:hypothetical protein
VVVLGVLDLIAGRPVQVAAVTVGANKYVILY